MQKARKEPKQVQEVHKPVLLGSWHGRDTVKLGYGVFLSLLVVTVIYLLLGVFLNTGNLFWQGLICAVAVFLAVWHMYSRGLGKGQSDAAFAEIRYQWLQENKPMDGADRDRCYHPAKGFFAALLGAAPFFLLTITFAVLTRPAEYRLGTLPGWLRELSWQSEIGDALRYYETGVGMGAMDILRVVARALVMPFVNVAVQMGDAALLWVERLSPLLVLIAPLGFGFGYKAGLRARAKINTSIAIGEAKKKRKEHKERKRRARSDSPQRLI